MASGETVRPHIAVLSESQIAGIHEHSLRVLSDVGVRVDAERARRLLSQAGARAGEGRRVFLPPELV